MMEIRSHTVRELFFKQLNADSDLINRASRWALWKALITFTQNDFTTELAVLGKHVIDTIIGDN